MCSIKNKFVYSNLKPETLAKNKFCCFLYHSQNFHSQTLNRAAMLTTMLRRIRIQSQICIIFHLIYVEGYRKNIGGPMVRSINSGLFC